MYVIPLYTKNGHDLPSHSKLKDKHYHGECPTDSSSESTQEEGMYVIPLGVGPRAGVTAKLGTHQGWDQRTGRPVVH